MDELEPAWAPLRRAAYRLQGLVRDDWHSLSHSLPLPMPIAERLFAVEGGSASAAALTPTTTAGRVAQVIASTAMHDLRRSAKPAAVQALGVLVRLQLHVDRLDAGFDVLEQLQIALLGEAEAMVALIEEAGEIHQRTHASSAPSAHSTPLKAAGGGEDRPRAGLQAQALLEVTRERQRIGNNMQRLLDAVAQFWAASSKTHTLVQDALQQLAVQVTSILTWVQHTAAPTVRTLHLMAQLQCLGERFGSASTDKGRSSVLSSTPSFAMTDSAAVLGDETPDSLSDALSPALCERQVQIADIFQLVRVQTAGASTAGGEDEALSAALGGDTGSGDVASVLLTLSQNLLQLLGACQGLCAAVDRGSPSAAGKSGRGRSASRRRGNSVFHNAAAAMQSIGASPVGAAEAPLAGGGGDVPGLTHLAEALLVLAVSSIGAVADPADAVPSSPDALLPDLDDGEPAALVAQLQLEGPAGQRARVHHLQRLAADLQRRTVSLQAAYRQARQDVEATLRHLPDHLQATLLVDVVRLAKAVTRTECGLAGPFPGSARGPVTAPAAAPVEGQGTGDAPRTTNAAVPPLFDDAQRQAVAELEARHHGETEELLQLLLMERARAVALEGRLTAASRREGDLLAMVDTYQQDAARRQDGQQEGHAAEASSDLRKAQQQQQQQHVDALLRRIRRLEDENVALIEAHGPLPM